MSSIALKENLGHFVKSVELHDTGGGCMVDFFILKSGKAIGISDECVVLYSKEQWDDGDLLGIDEAGIINLDLGENVLREGISRFTTLVSTEHCESQGIVDVIHLKNGQFLVVDAHNVALYANIKLTQENKITSAGIIDLITD